MKTLVICRGIPGSGKSTLARDLLRFDAVVCSADDYHTTPDGRYDWKPEKVGEAHAWCRGKAEGAMLADARMVVVDNTNIQRWQFASYLRLAERYGYTVQYAVPQTPWAWDPVECWRRNTHLVPFETIRRMKEQYEP